MYPYEARIREVKLYIKMGQSGLHGMSVVDLLSHRTAYAGNAGSNLSAQRV